MTHVNRGIVYKKGEGYRYGVCIEDDIGVNIIVIDAQTGERVTLLPADNWRIVRGEEIS